MVYEPFAEIIVAHTCRLSTPELRTVRRQPLGFPALPPGL
jgi:hypothetical protein